MDRQIFEVYAKVVDANGNYNTLSGYPKVFDSRNYDNDIIKAYNRAKAEYYSTLGTMYLRDDRILQTAILFRSDGMVLLSECKGDLNPPEVEEEEEE